MSVVAHCQNSKISITLQVFSWGRGRNVEYDVVDVVADLDDRPVRVQEVVYAAGPAVWRVRSNISVADQLRPD